MNNAEMEHKEIRDALAILLAKEKKYVSLFKMRHKIIFASVIFFAMNLVWYGMWEIVSKLPVLRNPIVALLVGINILIATGYFYENMISADFNERNSDGA